MKTKRRDETTSGFTLLELLVVITIIGLLAAIGIPVVSELTKSNNANNAAQQLADDLALARSRAIADRTTVYMVFVPTNFADVNIDTNGPTALESMHRRRDFKTVQNLRDSKYTTYALFARRSVGDQPGPVSANPRYLTGWKTLPEGTFIAPGEFEEFSADGPSAGQTWLGQGPGFGALPIDLFPFPSANSVASASMHYIAFNYLGQLVQPHYNTYPLNTQIDQDIHLTEGAIFYQRDTNSEIIEAISPDVQEVPPGNAAEQLNVVRINWLTGRALIDQPGVEN